MLRVVAGEYGGRRIATPKGTGTRPTSERVREALFSMLGPLEGLGVLDLFAGSGALGIEAISRGARPVVFVDRARAAVDCISANLELLGEEAPIIRADWRSALSDLAGRGSSFEAVLVDPPYADSDEVAKELAAALEGVVSPGAVVAVESPVGAPLVIGLPLRRERRHGDTLLRLYGSD